MALQPWKRTRPPESRKVGYLTIVDKHFVQPSGLEVTWTVVNEDDWAAAGVVAITADGQVIIARQFRAGPEMIMDDLPGGIVDPGETPEQCIIRELAEETGYQPGTVEYLGVCHYAAMLGGKRHYFLMTGCTPTQAGPQPTPDEDIEVRLVPIAELFKIAKAGRMTDPGGVLLAYDKLMELKEQTNG